MNPFATIKKRKILFITERRADYSRLKPIMKAVRQSKKLELQLVVTGMHLLKGFGETINIIKKDGFKIDAVLPTFSEADEDTGASKKVGNTASILNPSFLMMFIVSPKPKKC